VERNYLSRKTRFQMLITERPNIFTEKIIIVTCRRNPSLNKTPRFVTVPTKARQVPAGIPLDKDLGLYCTLQVPDAISPLVDRPQFLTFHI
jgi:hypothetical protein